MLCCGTLSTSQINRIIKAVKEGKPPRTGATPTRKKNKQTEDVVVAITAAIEKNWRLTVQELASMFYLTFAMVQSALTIEILAS
jgi:Na+-transporting methylmalonyl-CoA/oxaloacetate decarboxylase gamma subunit